MPAPKTPLRPDGGPERRHGRDDDYCGRERRGESRRLHSLPGEPAMSPATLAAIAAINARFDKGTARMDQLQAGQDQLQADMVANTRITEKLRTDLAVNTATTEEVREILELSKQGFRVLGWMGTGLMWTLKSLGVIATACLSLWAAYYSITHGGTLPPKH